MHELSIANNLVAIALEHAEQSGNVRVQQINLRIGALACVHRDALLFSFDLVTADTPLAGAKLHITDQPIVIYCPNCERLQELPGVQVFRCPDCQTPSADIRQGKELDIESIEVVEVIEPVAGFVRHRDSSTLVSHPVSHETSNPLS